MEQIERKIKHLNTLKRAAADIAKRIAIMEKEIDREMCDAYHKVNAANAQ